MSVVDLGAGNDPDPRADITTDIVELEGVDHVFNAETDRWPFDTASVEGIVARHVFEHLDHPENAFREAARVLEPGGWLELFVPLGTNAKTDPTHAHEWTWNTPLFFSQGEERSYYFDLPFDLREREITQFWVHGPLQVTGPLARRLIRTWGPGVWTSGWPCSSGELRVLYRRRDE